MLTLFSESVLKYNSSKFYFIKLTYLINVMKIIMQMIFCINFMICAKAVQN